MNKIVQVRHSNGSVSMASVLREWPNFTSQKKTVLLVDCNDSDCGRVHLVSESHVRNVFENWEGD